MKLSALIPAYNDDYALGFCLASIVEHFDEVIVLDDASTDDTPDVVADCARRHKNVRYVRHQGRQLGWVQARNRLATMTEADHLFWLDADDVLCEYNAHLLREIAEGRPPLVRLRLTEMWGDFHHTTQRLRHYDRCHVYINRRALPDFTWTGRTAARCQFRNPGELLVRLKPSAAWPKSAIRNPHSTIRNGPGPLFFHIKGVKPDRRLVERRFMRDYLRKQDRDAGLSSYCLADLDEAEIHRLALDILLHSKQDKLQPTYRRPLPGERSSPQAKRSLAAACCPPPAARCPLPAAVEPPRRPEVIKAALPGRFEIIYRGGIPVDRLDRYALPPDEKLEVHSSPT